MNHTTPRLRITCKITNIINRKSDKLFLKLAFGFITLCTSTLSFCVNIFEAIENNDINTIEKLANNQDFDFNKPNEFGKSPIYYACYKNKNQKIINLLLLRSSKETINKPNKFNITPLYLACWNNNPETVELLLPHCTQETINLPENCHGYTPLYLACCKGNLEIVKLLLEYNAFVDDKSIEVAKILATSIGDHPEDYANKIGTIFDLGIIFKLIKICNDFDKTLEKNDFIDNCSTDKICKETHDLLIKRLFHANKSIILPSSANSQIRNKVHVIRMAAENTQQ